MIFFSHNVFSFALKAREGFLVVTARFSIFRDNMRVGDGICPACCSIREWDVVDDICS
jgi:hypothetical protein